VLKLKVKQKRKYAMTTDSKHRLPIAQNVLNWQFSPQAPITYLWTQEGWLYLAVVIDLYSRRVVGWSMDKRMTKALVIRALLMADLRNPPPGLIHRFRSRQPIRQSCLPGCIEAIWHAAPA